MLLAWTKIVLADELLASDLPDDPYLDLDLRAYFPKPVREGFVTQVAAHPCAARSSSPRSSTTSSTAPG